MRKAIVLCSVAVVVLAGAAIAIAKSQAVKSGTSVSVTARLNGSLLLQPDGSTIPLYDVTLAGRITAGEASCRSGRILKFKVKVFKGTGYVTEGGTGSDKTGAWSGAVEYLLPSEENKILVELKPKRVDDFYCLGTSKYVTSAQVR